jgi:hypothetical protein
LIEHSHRRQQSGVGMTIDKQVASGLVVYLAGIEAGLALLPLHETGYWPLAAWTGFCVIVGVLVAEITAIASAIEDKPAANGRRVPARNAAPRESGVDHERRRGR